jgi:hypothetical protein
VCASKNELWCSVVARANVTDVGLSSNQNFSTSKITEFEDARVGIQ